jgi:hypothetical protein
MMNELTGECFHQKEANSPENTVAERERERERGFCFVKRLKSFRPRFDMFS